MLERYFLDDDHYTVEGHKIIADYLECWLIKKGIVATRPFPEACDSDKVVINSLPAGE